MASNTRSLQGKKIADYTKYIVITYPILALLILLVIPFAIMLVFSFYKNIPSGFYEPGFTLENYVDAFTSTLYRSRIITTLQVSVVSAIASLVVSYPFAYYLARTQRQRLKKFYLTMIVASLWLSFVIRAYAWTVILESHGVVNQIGAKIGILSESTSFVPSYWALMIGMVYVFCPYMILTLYTSINRLDHSLEEASKDLGAGPFRTFWKITLPLTSDGIISGSILVFILSIGVYVLPKLLGKPSQWTISVTISQAVGQQANTPLAAALSIFLVIIVMITLGITIRLTSVGVRELRGGV